MPHSFLRLKLVPFAIASMLAGANLGVSAAPVTFGNITLDATYALGGNPAVNGMTDPDASVYASSVGADLYLSKYINGVYGDSVFFHTYGFTGSYTTFGARVSATGEFNASTSTKLSLSFTNTSAAAQLFNFSFNVADGEVGLSGTGTGAASLALSVRKNGTEIAGNRTSITQTGSTAACSNTGLGALATYVQCVDAASSHANGNSGLFDVDFGLIAAGESFTLDYDIVATVSGNLTQGIEEHYVCDGYGGYGATLARAAVPDGDNGYGGYGGSAQSCSFQLVYVDGSAVSRSGDPFSQSGSNFNYTFSDPTTSEVPEPGTLALAGIAAAGLAAAGRRRRKQDPSA